ncbi:MAG: GWxTD domain-containing protein [Melioribacteraceae bacterium]|nr:GWxTD domain-containing protein [Melioribacteraceae bacterium]
MRGKINSGLVVFLCFLFFTSLNAQNKFEYDYARFYSPLDSTGYIELYYSFLRPALKTVEINDVQLKQGELGVRIIDTISNETVVDNSWQLDIPVNGIQSDELLVGVLDFNLDFSNYQIFITASDINNTEFEETSSFKVDLIPPANEDQSVSDIQLASQIVPQSSDENSIFYKNSMEVVPNPSLIFGDAIPVIFFYSEIYGLQSSSVDGYLIEQKLFNSDNNVVHSRKRTVDGINSSIVEMGAIPANKLNSGGYTLVVSVKNNNSNATVSSAKRVFIYNKDLLEQGTNYTDSEVSRIDSEFMVLSKDEIQYMWETAEYIATEMEKAQWEKLSDLASKRKFLSSFWEKRNPDKSSSVNELKNAYYERVAYVNRNYGNLSQKEGWKTDRGRVYLMYGVPDEIERFQNESYSKPYEVWHYRNIEGGVIFLFADELGMNIYRLVHSTKKGELYNLREYNKYGQR